MTVRENCLLRLTSTDHAIWLEGLHGLLKEGASYHWGPPLEEFSAFTISSGDFPSGKKFGKVQAYVAESIAPLLRGEAFDAALKDSRVGVQRSLAVSLEGSTRHKRSDEEFAEAASKFFNRYIDRELVDPQTVGKTLSLRSLNELLEVVLERPEGALLAIDVAWETLNRVATSKTVESEQELHRHPLEMVDVTDVAESELVERCLENIVRIANAQFNSSVEDDRREEFFNADTGSRRQLIAADKAELLLRIFAENHSEIDSSPVLSAQKFEELERGNVWLRTKRIERVCREAGAPVVFSPESCSYVQLRYDNSYRSSAFTKTFPKEMSSGDVLEAFKVCAAAYRTTTPHFGAVYSASATGGGEIITEETAQALVAYATASSEIPALCYFFAAKTQTIDGNGGALEFLSEQLDLSRAEAVVKRAIELIGLYSDSAGQMSACLAAAQRSGFPGNFAAVARSFSSRGVELLSGDIPTELLSQALSTLNVGELRQVLCSVFESAEPGVEAKIVENLGNVESYDPAFRVAVQGTSDDSGFMGLPFDANTKVVAWVANFSPVFHAKAMARFPELGTEFVARFHGNSPALKVYLDLVETWTGSVEELCEMAMTLAPPETLETEAEAEVTETELVSQSATSDETGQFTLTGV
jgi:hypothetical protein